MQCEVRSQGRSGPVAENSYENSESIMKIHFSLSPLPSLCFQNLRDFYMDINVFHLEVSEQEMFAQYGQGTTYTP